MSIVPIEASRLKLLVRKTSYSNKTNTFAINPLSFSRSTEHARMKKASKVLNSFINFGLSGILLWIIGQFSQDLVALF